MLKNTNNKSWLNLFTKKIDDETLVENLEELKKNPSIKNLELGWNHITDAGVVKLVNFLETNKIKLEFLSLTFNDIHNYGAIAFSKSEYIPSKLDLSDNSVAFLGAKALLENNKLGFLKLSNGDTNNRKFFTREEVDQLELMVIGRNEENPLKKLNFLIKIAAFPKISFPTLKEISLFKVNTTKNLTEKIKNTPFLIPEELIEDLEKQKASNTVKLILD